MTGLMMGTEMVSETFVTLKHLTWLMAQIDFINLFLNFKQSCHCLCVCVCRCSREAGYSEQWCRICSVWLWGSQFRWAELQGGGQTHCPSEGRWVGTRVVVVSTQWSGRLCPTKFTRGMCLVFLYFEICWLLLNFIPQNSNVVFLYV